jgi:hypothetical protein
MKTETGHRATLATLFLAVAGAMALTALLLRQSQGGVFEHITAMAAWLKGGAMPEVVTWPAWGYPWAIALIPCFNCLIFLQACVGALAVTLLAARLWLETPKQRVFLAILLVLAIPWHNTQVTLYPSALAGSLTLLGLLSLDTALANNNMRLAVLAGVLCGAAQNFRTEFVLLPIFLGVIVFGLKHFGIVKIPSFKPALMCIVVSLACQLPWAGFYYAHTGHFSLTESNLGHALYVSLGSDPNNPWGIKGDDQAAEDAVRKEGYSFLSFSQQGNEILLHIVFQKMRQHPYGVVQRTFRQLKSTLLAPFSWGEPRLDEKAALDLDVLREELKNHLGVGVNVRELEDYRSRDLYPQAKNDRAALLALLYQVGTIGCGSLILLFGILGMILVAFGIHQRPLTPLLYLLGFTAIYKVFQDVLLNYQVNYLSNVYPMLLPFVSMSIGWAMCIVQRHSVGKLSASIAHPRACEGRGAAARDMVTLSGHEAGNGG